MFNCMNKVRVSFFNNTTIYLRRQTSWNSNLMCYTFSRCPLSNHKSGFKGLLYALFGPMKLAAAICSKFSVSPLSPFFFRTLLLFAAGSRDALWKTGKQDYPFVSRPYSPANTTWHAYSAGPSWDQFGPVFFCRRLIAHENGVSGILNRLEVYYNAIIRGCFCSRNVQGVPVTHSPTSGACSLGQNVKKSSKNASLSRNAIRKLKKKIF